jgi:non-heme chloroperoxidase
VQAKDGTDLDVQDWGAGRPVVLAGRLGVQFHRLGRPHCRLDNTGFPLRGGRPPWSRPLEAPSGGYDLDTLADDVAALFEQRDLRDVIVVAHSIGSIEVVRYLTRHSTRRVNKLDSSRRRPPS